MALRGSGIFLPLTFAVFFPGKVNRKFGIMAIIGGIAVACLWKYIVPWKINGLFPALACNLLFLVPGLLVKKDE